MGMFSWALFGLISGAMAKLVMPGQDMVPGGWFVTILIGIAGAIVGGVLGSFIGVGSITDFDLRSLLISIVAATLLLYAYSTIKRRA
jgi:uncharacterized membrane protein YeaQ/YmgE (transglycosylase-associated protein family)